MKKMLILGLLVFSLILSGCWDMIDVEKVGYVTGLVIQSSSEKNQLGQKDTSPDETNPGPELEEGEDYRLTMQIILPQNIAAKEGGGGGEKPVWVLSGTGKTIFEIMRGITNRTGRPLGISHLRTIILSEEIARKGIMEVMDYFTRRYDVGYQSDLFVAPSGLAGKIMEVQPEIEKINAIYLFDLIHQAVKVSKSAHIELGDLFMNLRDGTSFVIPRIVPGENEMLVAGGAVFKKDRMVGWLGESDLHGYHWVTGQMQGGMVTVGPFPCPDDPTKYAVLTYDITEAKRRIRPHVSSDGKVSFTVNISTEGNIGEIRDTCQLDQPFIEVAEKEVTRAIKEQVEHVLLKMQQELGADIFGFESELKKRYPGVAEMLDWNAEFPNVEVAVHVKVFIRRIGLAERQTPPPWSER